MKFVTKKYKDGSKISYEWSEILDGVWPYPKECKEIIFIYNTNNPNYGNKR